MTLTKACMSRNICLDFRNVKCFIKLTKTLIKIFHTVRVEYKIIKFSLELVAAPNTHPQPIK